MIEWIFSNIDFLPANVNGFPCSAIRHDKPVTQIFASSALLATRSNDV